MKNKINVFYSLIIMLSAVVNFAAQAQQIYGPQYLVETKVVSTPLAPKGIVRNIRQDKKGIIWITSWEGVYKYDGETFTNATSKVSTARFFSVLEDRKGNFWFASIGSGVYYYDGKSFQNFTTKDGLASDRVTNLYEDKTGTIWIGSEGGLSLYDPSASLGTGGKFLTGKSDFQNLKLNEARAAAIHTATDSVHVSEYEHVIPEDSWMHNDVNAIIEDNTGKFWIGTRGYATIYDARLPDGRGKKFTPITNNGKPFTNVRSIIKDKKGNIWLGGNDGLWRYDGYNFTNFTKNFVGYIYEDKRGNIWTSSGKDGNSMGWALSRYDEKTLNDKKPTVTEIANKPMIFGILEDDKGNIWFGDFDGVHRYDGKTITDFIGVAEKQ